MRRLSIVIFLTIVFCLSVTAQYDQAWEWVGERFLIQHFTSSEVLMRPNVLATLE